MFIVPVKAYFVRMLTPCFTFIPCIYKPIDNLTAVLCYSNTGLIVGLLDLNALYSQC